MSDTATATGVKLVGTSGNDEIQTPKRLFAWLNWRFNFDYDAFASHENALCDLYSTIDGTFMCQRDDPSGMAVPYTVSDEDAFGFSWANLRVYCNPPYSRGLLARSIDKMVEEKDRAAIIVALVKVDTSTAWWRKLAANAHIEFLDRVRYEYPDGRPSVPATFASAVAILVPDRNGYKT